MDLPEAHTPSADLRGGSSPLPLLALQLTPDRRCTASSTSASDWFGLTADDVVGLHLNDLFAGDSGPMAGSLEAALDRPGTNVDSSWADRTGEVREVRVSCLPALRGLEQPGLTVCVSDETNRRRLERRRLDATRSRAAVRAGDQVIAQLTHDLASPLNVIALWSRLFRAGKLDDAGREEGLASIDRAVRSQRLMINQLREYGSVVNGNLHLQLTGIDIREILQELVGIVGLDLGPRPFELRCDAPPQSIPLQADAPRLRLMFESLLSMVIRVTPPTGRITLTCTVVGPWVEFTVGGDGTDIPVRELHRAFEPHLQTRRSDERVDGSGVGLTLARCIVEGHGGRLAFLGADGGRKAGFLVQIPAHGRAAKRVSLRRPPTDRAGTSSQPGHCAGNQ